MTEFVQAHIFSDDDQFHHLFNAIGWFEQATDEEIQAIFENDRGHYFDGEPTKTVARYVRTDANELGLVLSYCDTLHMDYTVRVDANTAKQWICQHRPHLIDATPKGAS